MTISRRRFATSFGALLTLAVTGCGSNSSQTSTGGAAAGPSHAAEATHEHGHATEGPHGGGLIELGNEDYHAELLHDDTTGTVTVYVLDSAARASVPIDAAEVSVNLKHEGRAEQFKLAASPEPGDPSGKSSRFVSSHAELAEDLDHERTGAELVITINGKPYRGALAHHHGHNDEHAHE